MTEEVDLDCLTSTACETSMIVADLFEQQDPTAAAEYMRFYDVAIQALELHQEQLSQMQSSRNSFMDQVVEKLTTLQMLNEEVAQLDEEIANSERQVNDMRNEIEIATDRNRLLNNKLSRYTFLADEVATREHGLQDIKSQVPIVTDRIASEKEKQHQIEKEIESLQKKLEDIGGDAKGRIKKNQMKAAELEAKIKRVEALKLAEQNVSKPAPLPEPVKKSGPSMIVHRTRDADADEVRTLRIEMEEAIKENAALKTQLNNIEQDLSAMHEENMALKTVMRSVMAQEKK